MNTAKRFAYKRLRCRFQDADHVNRCVRTEIIEGSIRPCSGVMTGGCAYYSEEVRQ